MAIARLAETVMDACRQIARFTETPGSIQRTYLCPQTREVHAFLTAWMERLGMSVRVDAAGNLRGTYAGRQRIAASLLIGSHIDTVPNAGAFDGVLGVALGLGLIELLAGERLEYAIEVAAFSEEEGVRFRAPFLGSRALVGTLDELLLQRQDQSGTTIGAAISDYGLSAADLPTAVLDPLTFAYLEFHIEQGPVLESLNLSLGVVEAIAGQSRYQVLFCGNANHAGTTPMSLRRDALAGAAEWILSVEREARNTPGLVATVGQVRAAPGATNVVPGEVELSLDVRHAHDRTRHAAVDRLLRTANELALPRGLTATASEQLNQQATLLDPALLPLLEEAVRATGGRALRLVSGAGHDAMVLAARVPSAMLFLRSPGGVSHHPDESVLVGDVRAALEAGLYFLQNLNLNAEGAPGV